MAETYTTAAGKGFAQLITLYRKAGVFDGNFWFGGNALETCLDYLINAGVKDKDNFNILETAYYQVYAALSPESINGRIVPVRKPGDIGWWRDDYGWWGNAFVLAMNNRDKLGYTNLSSDEDLFNNIAKSTRFCWAQLTGSWYEGAYGIPQDNAEGQDATIKGGVFNVPTQYTPDGSPPMQGRNSVTNEGYWLLSQGLAKRRNANDPDFGATAVAMQKWFADWRAHTPAPGIFDGRGLVLERPTGNAHAAGWCWTGDQGLQFKGLSNAGEGDIALKIANSAVTNLATKDASGVMILHESLAATFSGFEVDYATGKGIFLRNLVSPGVAPAGGGPFAQFIKNNAAAVWNHRLDQTTNQFSYNWAGADSPEPRRLLKQGTKSQDLCDLVMQASGQDALNTAMRIAPTEPIPGS
jgi:hypothetical protein